MDIVAPVAMAAGLGWASGLRLYAVLFSLGALHYLGMITLPPDLEIVAHPAVMAVSGALFLIEFGADKIPGFDSVWDTFQTFIRCGRCRSQRGVRARRRGPRRHACRRRALHQGRQPRADQHLTRTVQQLDRVAH